MGEYCIWCGKTSPVRGKWITSSFKDGFIYFCSHTCRKEASVNKHESRGLDYEKIMKHLKAVARKTERENKKMLLNKTLLEKERFDNDDLIQFFIYLTPKQKQQLAVVGLYHIAWKQQFNPDKILVEIKKLGKNSQRV